ncbi:unnamed protein product [Somion occarium]|uniref:Poly [ADP-ribose] polymerase n=1 Tax=Somion occarium TaxID=3059160 RepID=A0ABP1CNI4_9APHY
MPPRKKAAADVDGTAATRATRSSTRTRAPSAKAQAVAAAASGSASSSKPPSTSKPASSSKPPSKVKPPSKTKDQSKAKAPASKAKGKKRPRDEEEDPAEDEPEAKKAKADDSALDDIAEDKEEEEQNMVTVIQRGAAPVDSCSGMVATHQVYANGVDSSCVLFTRWGRVGENGQQQQKGPFAASLAVSEFKKQFKAKAGVNWEQRHGMVPRKGKYTFLERDYEEEKEKPKSSKGDASKGKEPEKIPDSTLPNEIQALCKLIFSIRLMDAHLKSMQYDANKLPLGKLSKATIMNGFAALKALSEVLNDPTCDTAKDHGGFRSAIELLTGRYYSIIPHVFPRTARPTVIDDINVLKKELDLVDALGDMEVASKLIASSILTDESGAPINPIDAHFRSLRLTDMSPIDKGSKEFKGLNHYTHDTHGATHGHYKVHVQYAYRVERQEETDAWLKSGFDKLSDGDRLLLWHGSRTTNFAGILKQGLRIAPPEAPATGYMFGKGVYFADMMSKSANYCHSYLSDNTGLLLLCEVAVKPFYEEKNANYNADKDCASAKALCTKGLGRTQPAEWQDAGSTLEHDALKGCLMPKGPGKDIDDPQVCLQYNEYIVYDASQIRVRYLLMVKME